MMRAITIAIVLFASARAHAEPDAQVGEPSAAPVEAQHAAAELSEFDQLRTPDSPAFVILGVSPTEIQRPTTPDGLVASLGGFIVGGDLTVPKNFALEVAPYWLFGHPQVSFKTYRADAGRRPLRTFTVSVGTTQTDRKVADATGMETVHTDSDIGLGFRTMLYQHGEQAGEQECRESTIAFADGINQASTLSKEEGDRLASFATRGTPAYDVARKKVLDEKLALLHSRWKPCTVLVTSTTGFSVNLAGALDVRAADSKLTRNATSIAGYALWLDASYDTGRFSTVALARIASKDEQMVTQRVIDAGVRSIYKGKRYAVSGEALVRHLFSDPGEATTYKLDVAVEYKVQDSAWLSLTFGKNFAFAPGEVGSLFSLANLQWSFDKSSLKPSK